MRTCPTCKNKFDDAAALLVHQREVHGRKVRKAKVTTPALDQLRTIQLQVSAALNQLETERDDAQRKVLELDDTIAKYKKMLVNGA